MKWNNLFEWHLSLHMKKRSWIRGTTTLPNGKDWGLDLDYAIKPDIHNPRLAYDRRGKLNLADVRPVGFLVNVGGK